MSVTCKEPKLRFKEFKDKLEAVKLKDIISTNTYGPRFNANDYHQNGNVRTIRGTDISLDGTIKYEQVPLAKLDTNLIKNHILRNGDLVMITTAECGLTGIFEEQEIDYIPSAYAVKIKLNSFNEPYYFKYFFQTHLAKKEINKYIRKATVANLPASDILRIKFNLPQKPEQEKIASFLSAVDSRIEQLTKKEQLLRAYKKGVMQKIFSGEIRFKDDDGSEFPEWDEKRLKEIAIKKSSNISANKIEDNVGTYIIYGASGILKLVDFYEEENDYISIVKDGAGVGRIFYCKGKSSVLGTMDIIKPKNNLNTYFLYCLLENIDFVKYVSGSTIPHIYFKDYSKTICNLPSLKEQTKIANFLSSIDRKIEQTAKELNLTKEFKKGLLQQMFV